MATPLRPIAVHVTEPEPGAFRWVLAELAGDHTWSELQCAGAGCSSYHQAMADGLVALEAMVEDLDRGPRMHASGGAGRAARVVNDAPGKETPGGTARRSVFGFGLAN